MKKIIVVVRDGCVENVFIDTTENVELEIVDYDSAFDSKDEQEAMEYYVNNLQQTMKSI